MLAWSLSLSRSSRGTRTDTSACSSSDDNHGQSYTITRYYYTQDQRTEQSIDVYEPFHKNNKSTCNKQEGLTVNTNAITTIVFVMGSGWLGHAWWVYNVTNWWNASGPAMMAKLGYRCISVRHSGGFFQVPPLWWMVVLVPLVVAILVESGGSNFWWFPMTLEELSSIKKDPQELRQGLPLESITAMVGIIFLWMCLHWQAKGAAHLDDMIHDITQALQYIRHNILEQQEKNNIILGGYSSGGHVVATWLSRQTEPLPWIRGVLYVSGVLSLDAPLMNVVTLSVFGKWAHAIPSPYTNRGGTTMTLSPPPATLPHLVIGCHNETFGIPILDATFCASAYVQHLQTQRPTIQAKCVLVHSNHWFILSSDALSFALQQHLPWLLTGNEKVHKTLPPSLQPSLASTASLTGGSRDDLDDLGFIGEQNEKKVQE